MFSFTLQSFYMKTIQVTWISYKTKLFNKLDQSQIAFLKKFLVKIKPKLCELITWEQIKGKVHKEVYFGPTLFLVYS